MVRTLILRGDHLGDAILTTPLIRALAKAGHEVDFLIPDAYLPLFAGNPFLHAVHGLRAVAPGFPSRWMELARWIRRQRYDVLIVSRFLPRALLPVSLFCGVKRRLAFAPPKWRLLGKLLGSEWLIHDSHHDSRHYSDVALDFARRLDVAPDGLQPEIFLQPEEIAAMKAQLHARWGDVPLVGLHPGHNQNACHPSSAMCQEMARLILEKTDWRLVLTGVASEQRLVENWPPAIRQSDRLWNTMGAFSLRESAALIKCLNVYICPSTGTLHIASALGTPTITAFCPVNLISENLWGARSGRGEFFEPTPASCREADILAGKFCDFSGKVQASQFFEKASQLISLRV